MKKLLFFGIVFLSVFVIYLATMDRKVYYLSLGDSSKYLSSNKKDFGYSYYVSQHLNRKKVLEDYVYGYSASDKKIPDLIRDIQDNSKIKKYTLKNCLVKADLVTLRINADDVVDRVMYETSSDVYDYIDDLCRDFESLLKLIRQYCKEDVLFLGYLVIDSFTSDEKDAIEYLNKKYKDICSDYDVTFVDLNSSDDKNVSNQVIKIVDKKLFEG